MLKHIEYPDAQSQSAYFEGVLKQIKSVSGVEAVGADAKMPFMGLGMGGSVEIEGCPAPDETEMVAMGIVNPDYFRTMAILLIRGRKFTDQDRRQAPKVVLVNETFVRKYFPNEDPLGIRINCGDNSWHTIIGVVGDVRDYLYSNPPPQTYCCYLQASLGTMSLAVRTAGDPLKLAGAIRSAVMSIDNNQPLFSLMSMEQRLAEWISPQRMTMLVLASFALLALGLISIGIYGVISYLVTERTHEIGVRMALGASPTQVLALVLKKVALMAGTGVAAGVLSSLCLTRLIAS